MSTISGFKTYQNAWSYSDIHSSYYQKVAHPIPEIYDDYALNENYNYYSYTRVFRN